MTGSDIFHKNQNASLESKVDSYQFENDFTKKNTKKAIPKNDAEKIEFALTERRSQDIQSEIQKLHRRYKLGHFKEDEYKKLKNEVYNKYKITKQDQIDSIDSHFKH